MRLHNNPSIAFPLVGHFWWAACHVQDSWHAHPCRWALVGILGGPQSQQIGSTQSCQSTYNQGGAVITAPDIMMPQRLSARQEVTVGHIGPVQLECSITHGCLRPHKALLGLGRVEVKHLLHRPGM